LFGLLADVTDRNAIDRLFSVKPRLGGVAVILPNREAWAPLVTEIPAVAARLADRFWPGPLTIALPVASGVDPRLTVDGTIGVRLPGPSVAATLAARFGRPLTATSANRHGEPPATEARAVVDAFSAEIARGDLYVVAGSCRGGLPSTVVVVQNDCVFAAREGAISERDIEAATRSAL
jgi:L-threonylcarbamoyladenylate synthase